MALKLWLILHIMSVCGASSSALKPPQNNPAAHSSVDKIDENEINLPTKKKTTNASEKVTPKDIESESEILEEVDWRISHKVYSIVDKYNESITHYYVTFDSFACKDIHCNCEYLTMRINIDSIQRPLKPIACDNKLQFDILPGIEYEFQITPNVLFDDTKHTISQYKTFSVIYKKIPDNTVSFELQMQLDNKYYASLNMDTDYLSTKLIQELSELCEIHRHEISFAVVASSSTTIHLMIPSKYSTQSQIAIEAARNLLYVPDTTLLSTIIQNSVLVQPVAVIKIISTAAETSDEAEKFNYGFLFICIVMLCSACFLMAKYAPNKFAQVYDLFELIADVIKHNYAWFVEKISNVSNIRMSQEPYQYDHDILNISADLDIEMEEDIESGIVLLDEVFQMQNVDLFTRERYIQTMRDNWLTTVDQLKQLNKQDWKRFGIPENIQNVIQKKLLDDDTADIDSVATEDISRELSFGSCTESKDNDVNPELLISDTDFSDF